MSTKQSGREVFALKVQAELKKALPAESWRYEAEEYRLVPLSREGVIFNLEPAFDHFKSLPIWKKSPFVRHRVGAFLQMLSAEEPSEAAVRSQLRPKIRERILLKSVEIGAQADGRVIPTPAYRVLGEHLTLEVALDLPTAIRGVGQEQLEDWGMTFDDALAFANENLLKTGTDRFRRLQPGLFVSAWNDDYDCSRLHLPDVIGSIAVKGRPVAMIPNRNTLIVTGADDASGLTHMAKYALDVLKKPGAMCGFAFRLDYNWTPYLPDPNHPAYAALRNLATDTWSEYYSQLAASLESLYKKRDVDIYVGRPIVATNPSTNVSRSLATWIRGVDTLLPLADEIAFLGGTSGRSEEFLGTVDWESARNLLGEKMEPQDTYPPVVSSQRISVRRTNRSDALEVKVVTVHSIALLLVILRRAMRDARMPPKPKHRGIVTRVFPKNWCR